RNRGALVSVLGIPRHALGQSRPIREVFAQLLRQRFSYADARHPRRARLPRTLHAGLAAFHSAADAACAVKIIGLPRRRPLDPETAKYGALVRHVPDLDRRVAEEARLNIHACARRDYPKLATVTLE